MSDISRYEDMWTTDLERYGLVEFGGTGPGTWMLFDLSVGSPLVIDDDEQILEELVMRLRRAGIRRMTPDEAAPRD